jgi:hypothetical protein
MHPLLDLKKLTDEQLQGKLNELMKRIHQTIALNKPGMQSQISSMIDSLRTEMESRQTAVQMKEDKNLQSGEVLDTGNDTTRPKEGFEKLIDMT